MDIFNPYYLQIVMFFIINAILGISIYFTLASGQLSLGAAGFMSVGAYVGALLSLKADLRSEERRVGKECRSRWSPYH